MNEKKVKSRAPNINHIKRLLLFFIACMALCALLWLNTSSQEANSFSSDSAVEGGGPGSAYSLDWDSRAEPLSAAQMDSVLEVVGIPNSVRARVLRHLRPNGGCISAT